MDKKQVNGQMDLFAYIDNIQSPEEFGQMEMVSLIPAENPKPKIQIEDLEILDLDQEPDIIEETKELDKAEETEEIGEAEETFVEPMPSDSEVVMSKYFKNSKGQQAFVEYRNYNRVLIKVPGKKLSDIQCKDSSEAVELYVNKMYEFMDDKSYKEVTK